MIILIGAFLASLIPALALFFWLREAVRKGQPIEERFKKLCNSAIVRGLVCSVPIILLSFLFELMGVFVPFLRNLNPVLKAAFHNMVVLALAEELVKYFMLKGLMRKNPDYAYGWLDVIVFMVSIGIGFELIEGVVYAFTTGPGQMLVRGVTAMHAVFGFIMGYFLGKGWKTGNRVDTFLGFFLPWLMHGLYDFGLSEELDAVSEWFGIISLALAGLSFILLIYMVFFMRKARETEAFTEPLTIRL